MTDLDKYTLMNYICFYTGKITLSRYYLNQAHIAQRFGGEDD